MTKGGFKTQISLGEAQRLALSLAAETGDEEVSLDDASSRVLSLDVVAGLDNPPFDRAMMDGYAVVAKNTFGASSTNPVALKVVGAVSTGDSPALSLASGEAIKIMTGAPIPKGADAVVKVEYTEELKGVVEVFEAVAPGKNISPAGEDIKKGAVLLKKGRVLRPHDTGVLAAIGRVKVLVKSRPRVKIASTGAELIEPGERLKPGSIYDINTYTLSALLKAVGGTPLHQGIIRDDEKSLIDLIRSPDWDVLLISGATSVGEKDFVPGVVERLGRIVFHGVSIRPGGPVGFGVASDKPVFMLPGFPVACITAFELLVTPFIQKMLGTDITSPHPIVEGILDKAIPSEPGRVDFVRVKVHAKKGVWNVTPIASKGAGLITTLSKADGFVLVDEKKEGVEAGERVMVHLF